MILTLCDLHYLGGAVSWYSYIMPVALDLAVLHKLTD